MTITINIQNEELFDRILWILEHFKDDGLEIRTSRTQQPKSLSLKTKIFKFDREKANSRK